MLTLTDNASMIINTITSQPGAPAGSALRITADAAEQGLAVSTATDASPGDQVVEQQGATVYLDEAAAAMLDDKVLDAAVDQEGRVEFAIGQQA